MPVFCQKLGPDYDVPIFDVSQSGVDVFLFWVRLGRSEKAVQIGRVRFVLPVVLERMDVDLEALWGCFAGLKRRRHSSISPSRASFCTGGNPWMRLDVLRHRPIKGDRMRAPLLLSALAATAATLNAQFTTAKPDSSCTNYSDGRVECRVFRGG